jgi:hypothetical protein
MSFGLQVYRGTFALAVRLPAPQFDRFNWLVIAVLLLSLAGLPLGLLPALVSATLALAFAVGMLLAELMEVGRWNSNARVR